MEQGSENRVTVTSTADAAARIMEATVLPPDTEGQDRMAALVGATVRDIPALTLACRPDMEAVEVAYEFLSQI